jgi:hypothetical protein
VAVVIVTRGERCPGVRIFWIERHCPLEHHDCFLVWSRVAREREAPEIEGVRLGVSGPIACCHRWSRAERRQQFVADPRRQALAQRNRVIRRRRNGVSPEQAVRFDVHRLEGDLQLGCPHRVMARHHVGAAELPAGLLRAHRRARELSRRRDGANRERPCIAHRRRHLVGEGQAQIIDLVSPADIVEGEHRHARLHARCSGAIAAHQSGSHETDRGK